MSNDKLDNTNGDSRNNDKAYYDDLYNDLPKEVVDILMQTHPLMSKGEGEASATAHRSRRAAREDVEEIREARMQQVGSEINEIRKAPQQEGDPTKYVSRRARSVEMPMEEAHNSSEEVHKVEEDEYDDGIQYVSVMPARKRQKMVDEVTLQTTSTGKRKKVRKEENEYEEFTKNSRPRYEDLDFEEKAKQEHLDSLYDDDYDDYDDRGGRGKLGIILGVIGLILVVFLIFKCVSLSSSLEEAKNQVVASQELNSKYEAIQLEKMQLEEELAKYKNPDAALGEEEDEGETTGSTGSTGTAGTTTGSSTGTSGGTVEEYTVVEGDVLWSIAQKVYGNGAEFQKILDANGMKESDTLKVGTKLKVPK